ncbi:MAG: Trk system potassium transporter TrkA [Muribaculaceae bacterium]|nr:Trk system potassium transporter TrkA [Muribaculaceae bacterium]
MKIVIAGAGEVGSHLAKLLSFENQDIVLIDSDASKLAPIDANYNLMTLVGRPTSFQTLRDAGVENCDLFIAVTPYETTNVVACTMAKQIGAERTVARIDNYEFMSDENRKYFSSMGVDSLIYPEYLAAKEIITALKRPWVRHWFELHDGEIILVGVKMRETAKLIGMQLKELAALQPSFHISAIKRNHNTIIPRGDDYIKLDDILYFTTTRDHVDDLLDICGKKNFDVRKVMIMGGSRIAIRTADLAGDDFKIKVIDNSLEKCQRLAEMCPDCDIVHADARDMDVLREEGLDDYDAFVALTDSSETNILACIMAKEFGVAKTIAEVENIQLVSEAESLNIGTTINKKLLASSTIFQLLLDTDSSTSKCHSLTDAEVAELEVRPGSKITRGPVKDLNLSREMTIAGLVRDGVGMLVTGNTVIQPGDHVVVFCLAGALHKVEKLFC